MRGLSLVEASGGHSSSRCTGLSLSQPLLLRSTGSRRAGSVVVAHGPSCSAACGIFPDQGLNPCPLHRQADSQPLRHQGSPLQIFCCTELGRGGQSHQGTYFLIQLPLDQSPSTPSRPASPSSLSSRTWGTGGHHSPPAKPLGKGESRNPEPQRHSCSFITSFWR